MLQKLLSPSAIKTWCLRRRGHGSPATSNTPWSAHIATPAVLVDALGHPPCSHGERHLPALASGGLSCTHAVRVAWRADGVAAGWWRGRRSSVSAWCPRRPGDPRVQGVRRRLTHGDGIWELADDGLEYRRAFYHGDLRALAAGEPA
ncbi:hypothetical protein [Nonomuraea dietziae]|uniref:hypothetical protein n=1 Tax=Nonomuraea dietziae TaxID=65515 RepID=UPI0031DAEEC3